MGLTESERQELVEGSIGLVRHIASQLVQSGNHFDREEAISEGYVGLVRASHSFDPDRGLKFTTFAGIAIKGAILDAFRRNSVLSRSERRALRQLDEAEDTLQARMGREVSREEVAQQMRINVVDIEEMRQKRRLRVDSLDLLMEAGAEGPVASGSSVEDEVVSRVSRSEMKSLIASLSPRHRQVISGLFMQGKTQSALASEMGISESRVSQLRKSALGRMRSTLQDHDAFQQQAA